MSAIIGLLLAAGASRRFGADKLMQTLPEGDYVAQRACRNLLAGSDEVLAVVRPGRDYLAACLRAEGANVLVCAEAEQGMGRSLAFAVRNCPITAAGYLVALADMPQIAPTTINSLADTLRSGAVITAPRWQGRRGHPVGFAAVLRPQLLALTGDIGAKAILQAYSDQLRLIDCHDAGILKDIDRPDDLNRFYTE